jgi:ubiquitin carboxyl-terminal hydrolase 4/11/15
MEFEMSTLIDRYDLSHNINYDGKKGLVGLKNIGNSCYMNTGIQCLSNTKELTEYFLSSAFTNHLNSTNPLGSNGLLACAYAKLIRDLWTCKNSEISPWDFKKAFSKFSPQFSGFGQHDSQEFIAALLDGLHEDTNLVKKKPVVPEIDFDGKDDSTASRLSQ